MDDYLLSLSLSLAVSLACPFVLSFSVPHINALEKKLGKKKKKVVFEELQ